MQRLLNGISTSWRTGMFSNLLVRELAAVLLIKVILISALWFAFFHHPDTTPLSPDDIEKMLTQPSPASLQSRPNVRPLP